MEKLFSDDGTNDWQRNWFLDGLKAKVSNTTTGMVLETGPVEDGDASHAVLWTKSSFYDDIRVEVDFTRMDSATNHTAVCIIYLHAAGVGNEPFAEDIFTWRHLRDVPKMYLYYDNLNCYHISYACTGGDDFNYVRARRYPAKGSFDKDTRILPSYDNIDLFKQGETWHFIFEKIGRQLSFSASKENEKHTWNWDASGFPPLAGGRIGLRQMRGRESKFANLQVFQL